MPKRPALFALCPQDVLELLELLRVSLQRRDPESPQTMRLRSLEARLALLLMAPEESEAHHVTQDRHAGCAARAVS